MANLTGTGAPTKQTVGAIGDIYTDSVSGKEWECTGKVNFDANNDGPGYYEYEWKVKTSGGGENGSGSGGFSGSWNDLTDKPFNKTVIEGDVLLDNEAKKLVYIGIEGYVGDMIMKDGAVPDIEVGKSYKFVVNDAVYQVECKQYENTIFFGNLNLFVLVMTGQSDDELDTGEPYLYAWQTNTQTGESANIIIVEGSEGEHTLALVECEKVEQIDTKYLPEHLQFGEVETSEVVLEETVLGEFMDISNDVYYTEQVSAYPVALENNQSYTVIINGAECVCEVTFVEGKQEDNITTNDHFVLGNHSLMYGETIDGVSNPECPVCIVYYPESNGIAILANFDATGSTLSIHHVTKEVKKIDAKYLPLDEILGVIENGTY